MPQYQGVWTLEQQAQAQSNQQWVTDPNFKNTTLLLQADGTGSGSQNNTFLDGSTNNFFITRNGNTTQGSFSPFSQAPGYWGNYFNGSTPDYLGFSTLTLSSSFTVEFFVYFPSAVTTNTVVISNAAGVGDNWIGFDSTNAILSYGGFNRTFSYTVTPNTWLYVQFINNASSLTCYVNGVQRGTAQTGPSSFALNRIVGYNLNHLTGYLSNIRVTNAALAATAPPTTPLTTTVSSGTVQLLTCQSNRFVDNSASPFTLTPSGTPSVQAFGPFAPALQWTPDVVGGSGYFDGTGDWLNSATSSNFVTTGDFTMEAWAYNTNKTTYQGIISQRSASGGPAININNSGQIEFQFGGSVIATSTMPINQWFHVAMSRSGSGANNISVYLNGTRVAQATNTGSTVTNNIAVGRYYTDVDNYYWLGYIASTRYTTSAIYSGATITVPTAPLIAVANTQLLLNFTNAGIYDGKMANNLETVGNAQVSTSPVKYGSGSMYFDGTGDNLLLPYSPLHNLSSDFTIEFWLLWGSSSNGAMLLNKGGGSGIAYASYELYMDTGTGNVRFAGSTTNASYDVGGESSAGNMGVITAGVWTHIAVTRAGTTFRGFVNGVQGFYQTGVTAALYNSSPRGLAIGSNYTTTWGTGTPTNSLLGYIDDLRITQACRYFANFTPPQQALPRQ